MTSCEYSSSFLRCVNCSPCIQYPCYAIDDGTYRKRSSAVSLPSPWRCRIVLPALIVVTPHSPPPISSTFCRRLPVCAARVVSINSSIVVVCFTHFALSRIPAPSSSLRHRIRDISKAPERERRPPALPCRRHRRAMSSTLRRLRPPPRRSTSTSCAAHGMQRRHRCRASNVEPATPALVREFMLVCCTV